MSIFLNAFRFSLSISQICSLYTRQVIMEETKNSVDLGDKKSYAGIPEAEFVDDVDAYMAKLENAGNVDKVLKKLDEQHSKYKFMELNLLSKRKRLRAQIPDLKRSLSMIEKLQNQKEEFETEYLLSANVMLEYSLEDAKQLLTQNISTATKNLGYVEHDLDFLRDQFTTTEVNMARVFNWDVKRRQAAKGK
ncbi:Prefoldin subunit [Popillia japonica]|uniref:Prefoldin subunit 3 n=1 Tax=Popillia japonica TaxID=7064 RepID=A0AAW1J0U9_POPJA